MIINNSNFFKPKTVINKNLGAVSQNGVLGRIYLQQVKESYGNGQVIRNLSRIQDKDRVSTLGKGYGTLFDYSVF